MIEYRVMHLFGGRGGFAIGFQRAKEEFRGIHGEFETVCGIDHDPYACKDFQDFTGVQQVQIDLFSREDYEAFHGHPPPAGWREATPEDIRAATGGQAPHVVTLSPPCKGFSSLLPKGLAGTRKYLALNNLTSRGVWLVLEAFNNDLPAIINLENVPLITIRGKKLLSELKRLLASYGYVFHDGYHDCGELGGLAQIRRRYFLMCRHPEKAPIFIYKPPKKRVRAIKEVIHGLPMPGDPAGGPMHKLPRLDFITQLRLALIRPGGDWKDIPGPGQWRLMTLDGREVPPSAFTRKKPPDPDTWGRIFVVELLPGARHYEDVRLRHQPMGNGRGAFWVQDPDNPSGTVTADPGHRKAGGAAALADVNLSRRDVRYNNKFQNNDPEGPSATVTGVPDVQAGGQSMPDHRLSYRQNRHTNKYKMSAHESPSDTVTGSDVIGSGAQATEDTRLGLQGPKFNHVYRTSDADDPSGTVAGGGVPGSGAISWTDHRVHIEPGSFDKSYGIRPDDEPTGAVTSGGGPSSSGGVRDARLSYQPRDDAQQVADEDKPSPAVTGHTGPSSSNGPGAVRDTRLGRHPRSGVLGVQSEVEASRTVTPHTDPNGDAPSTSDARMGCRPQNGTVGVVAWNGPSPTVIASIDVYAGPAAVEDKRVSVEVKIHYWPEWFPDVILISPWNAWHRPMTTYELLALQSFPLHFPDGRPVVLAGASNKRWREGIGNAVPPDAAEAIGRQILKCLIMNEVGIWEAQETDVWVQPGREDLPLEADA